jgi:hypothetical protein
MCGGCLENSSLALPRAALAGKSSLRCARSKKLPQVAEKWGQEIRFLDVVSSKINGLTLREKITYPRCFSLEHTCPRCSHGTG